MEAYTIVSLVIYCLFLLYSITTTIIFGEGNNDYYKVSGPYQVGHRDDYTSNGNAISIYYPMDIEEYDKVMWE